MNLKRKNVWVILAALLVLVLVSCDNGTTSGDTSLGESLTLSGQVYWRESGTLNFEPYTGADTTIEAWGGSGSIKNGQLSFEIGVPADFSDIADSFVLAGMTFLKNVQLTPSSAKTVNMQGFWTSGGAWLMRIGEAEKGDTMWVSYLYTDMDATVTGTGSSFIDGTDTYTTQDTTLHLKKGWNPICHRYYESNKTFTITVKDNSNCKWAISR